MAPVPVPMSFELSAALLGFYILAALNLWFRRFGGFKGSENFSLRWWWALIVARLVEALIPFCLHLTRNTSTSISTIISSLAYDTGLYCIVMALLRTTFIVIDNKSLCLFKITRRVWSFLIFALLLVGWLLGNAFTLSSTPDEADALEGVNRVAAIFATLSHIFLGMAMTLLALTMVIISVLCAKPFLGRWNNISQFNHCNWIQLLALYTTSILFFIRIVPDLLRVWMYRSQSFVENVSTGVVPELLIVCGWLWLARVITRWDGLSNKIATKAVIAARGLWFNWRVPEKHYKYMKRDHRIMQAAGNASIVFGWFEDPQTAGDIEVPGLIDMIDYYTSCSPAFRREKSFLRPAILAAAETFNPGLRLSSSLYREQIGNPSTEVISQKLDDFQRATTSRIGSFTTEIMPDEDKSRYATSSPQTVSADATESYSELYNRAEVSHLLILLKRLSEAAVANMCFKIPLSQSIFRRPTWEVDVEYSLQMMKRHLMTKDGYPEGEAEVLVNRWGRHILFERGKRVVSCLPAKNNFFWKEMITHPYLFYFTSNELVEALHAT